ncbi:MAG: LytTR family DNA-binding domain-containing protein [Prolixibacteraceae bacterium]|jgi:two-component system LytT family response regulator|nr:LytTR family DNA-binding domain-containing protein [Prolixibacteraceae bacterium]
MRLLIVDGISSTREEYIDLVDKKYLSDVSEANSAEDAAFHILERKPDVIITSDVLSFRSGYELVKLVDELDLGIPVIVISNDTDRAILAINNNAFDFIVKPVSAIRLNNAIDNALNTIKEMYGHTGRISNIKDVKVKINTTSGFRLIELNKLMYCEAEGTYTKLFFEDGGWYYSTYNLGKIENLIKDYFFIRINRSVLINLSKVKLINKKDELCVLEDGIRVSFNISKKKIREMEKNLTL